MTAEVTVMNRSTIAPGGRIGYEPHILHPVGDSTPKPPTEHLLPDDDEIRKRAIADAERSFQNVRDDLRRLIRTCRSKVEKE